MKQKMEAERTELKHLVNILMIMLCSLVHVRIHASKYLC